MALALSFRTCPAAPPRDDRGQVSFSLTDLVAALCTGLDHAHRHEAVLDRREGRA